MMKCLLCHNSYKQPGGEDRVFEEELRLLRSRGHEVFTYTAHNDAIDGMTSLEVAGLTLWNPRAYEEIRALIRRVRPAVMHCTNVFPQISPAAYYAAQAEGVPVVQSLHNYRLFCSNGFLFRDGHPCERCLGATASWQGVIRGCYRDSRAASAVVAAMQATHHATGTWRRAVDLYISCSAFARRKLIAGGLPEDSVVVKPNFVCDDPGVGAGRGGYAVFVGRLSPEKGIDTLLEAWSRLEEPIPLAIIGDGPLADRVRYAAMHDDRINWHGWLAPGQMNGVVGEAACLLMTSLWPEIFGRTVIEAFASGTPVVASGIGALTELVDHGRTGILVPPGDADALAGAVRRMARSRDELTPMRAAARAEYERHFTAARNYDLLLEIYERASDVHRRRRWNRTVVPPDPGARVPVPVTHTPRVTRPSPRVSLGIPVYNGAEYLPQALDALLAQTFQDFEIIISDNVSTDRTEAVCRRYAARDPRIHYYRRQVNVGAIKNFNAVFQTARGEYFKWASHDDLCAPTFLERCVEVLDADPAVAWCHTRSTHIDSDGVPLELPGMADVSYAATDPSRESARPSDRFRAVLLGDGGCLDSYGLIRTSAIHRSHLYLPYFGSEKVFVAELALLGSFREIPEVLFYPRVHARAAGSLPTAADQVAYTNPGAPSGALRRRLGLLRGYLRVVHGADVAVTERTRALVAIGRWLLQARKWRRVVEKALTGDSMGDDVRRELFDPPASERNLATTDGTHESSTSRRPEPGEAHG